MPLSYQQLRTPMTETQALNFLLDTLTSLGFRVGSWHEGSVQRNVLTAFARNGAGLSRVVSDLVYNLIDNPNGQWLDLLGRTLYRLTRDPGAFAIREVVFTAPASSPPTVIENGTQVRASSVAFSVVNLVAPVTILPGTSVTFTVRADAVGRDGNTGVLPRVIGKGGLRAAWLGEPSVNGADRETDARYLTRCDLRFAELTYSVGLRAYELWALNAAPSVNRVRALTIYDDPDSIMIALDPGTPSEIALVEAYIVGRSPPRDLVSVVQRNTYNQVIKVRPRVAVGTTSGQIQTLLQATLDAMPIGGWRIVGAPAGRLLRERLSEALLCRNGARSAGIITPEDDPILGGTDIVIPTWDIEVDYA